MTIIKHISSFLLLIAFLVGCSHDNSEDISSSSSRIAMNDVNGNTITCFTEDSFGYMWMGTNRGVVRYDGEKYYRYLHNSSDENTFTSNIITELFTDSRGTIWVGTVDGVARQTQQDVFVPVGFDHSDNRSQSIFEFMEAPDGKVYMSTADFLEVYDYEHDIFVSVMAFENGKALRNFCFDKSGRLYYLSEGIIRVKDNPSENGAGKKIDIAGDSITQMRMLDNGIICTMNATGIRIWSPDLSLILHDGAISGNKALRADNIASIYPGKSTSFFIVTKQYDIWMYDYSNQSLRKIDAPAGSNTVFVDSRDYLWLGTASNGFETINMKDIDNSNINLKNLYKGITITSLSSGLDGRLCVNSEDYGLYVISQDSGDINSVDFEKFSTLKPLAVFIDSEERLWVSTSSTCHVFRINGYSEDTSENLKNLLLKELAVFNTESGTMFIEDKDGNVWLSTSSHSLYLCRKGTLELDRLVLDVESGFMFFPEILCAKNGKVYAPAFHYGIYEINPETSQFKLVHYVIGELNSNFLPTCMIETEDGEFWIGTKTEGLLSWDPSSNILTHIPVVDCESINTLVEYPEGVIWVGTVDGIYSYNKTTGKTFHFTQNGRNSIGEISSHSSLVLNNGNIVFGSKDGIVMVDPSSSSSVPDVEIYFNDLYVNGNRVAPTDNGTIDKEMRYSPEVKLRKGPNSVSFEFCSPMQTSHMVEYWYKLDDYQDFQKTVSGNTIQFSHLPEGRYRLTVQARDEFTDGIVGENSVDIRVVSPLLTSRIMTSIIYPFIALLFFVLLLRGYLNYKNSLLEKERILKEKQSEEDLNKMNISFFTNMSHEFRTPLTLIQGPIEELSEIVQDSPYNCGLISTAKRSVDRMLKLIDQIMDFSKLETDALNLSLYECRISALFHAVAAPFKYLCSRKGISYEVHDYCDGINAFVDPDKFEKIMNNILSNAIKYTPSGANGLIKVTMQQVDSATAASYFRSEIKSGSKSYILISVSDNGIGIPEDKLEEVFERYRRLDSPGAENQYSSGIGLYYVRRLVSLHHGIVEASSQYGKPGACFRVLLPLDKQEYEGEIFIKGDPSDIYMENETYETISEKGDGERPDILVVEDDIDVASYVSSLLGKYYNVKVEYSATEACEEIKLKSPDLLITDIMLPGDMDGLMLCKFIKDNIETCHIPVMILSAKSALEDQISGIETGADSYVTKPVAPAYLLTLTKTLLSNREKLRSRLQKSTDVEDITEGMMSPQDKLFLESLFDIMEKQLSNNELNINSMAESLRISRAKLYYKFKGLMNETPNSYFKKYKLNRAAELLKSGKYNISEVSDMTGFSSLSYFSVSFKKQFGVKPTEYR